MKKAKKLLLQAASLIMAAVMFTENLRAYSAGLVYSCVKDERFNLEMIGLGD